jgi:protocatechuate 3,4-dioxygenase beta subunit
MKMLSTLFIIGAATLSISMTSQAATVLTATGRTSLQECKSWERITLTEKQTLQDNAATYAQDEMETACHAQGATPVVLDVTVRGYKCATLAQAGLYLMDVSYTCAQ